MCLASAHDPRRAEEAVESAKAAIRDDYFSLMCDRLAGEGGLVSEQVLDERWRRAGREPGELAAWLDSGRLRSIPHGQQRWLPCFQFQPDGRTPRADVDAVASELEGAMDAAEILTWLACGNASLDGDTPLHRLRSDLPTVLEVARLDRFIGSA